MDQSNNITSILHAMTFSHVIDKAGTEGSGLTNPRFRLGIVITIFILAFRTDLCRLHAAHSASSLQHVGTAGSIFRLSFLLGWCQVSTDSGPHVTVRCNQIRVFNHINVH